MLATCALATPSIAWAETYGGRDVADLAHQSIDVMRAHHYALAAQMRIDEVTPYTAAVTYKHLGARLRFPDGSEGDGGLTRINAGAMFGGGRPRSGGGAFGGLSADYVVVNGAVPEHTEIGNGLVFAGAAFRGVQGSIGLRFGWSRNFTAGGEFPAGANPYVDRPGTPAAYASPQTFAPTSHIGVSGYVVSLQQAEGVTFGGLVDDVLKRSTDGTVTRSTALIAARLILEPERLVERLDLRRAFVPGLGVERIAPEVDYWGDRFQALRAAGSDPAAIARVPVPTQATYELPLQLSDIAGLGVRVKTVTQVAPTALFRQAEVGWSSVGEMHFAGLKTSVFRRADAYTGAVDLFAGVRVGKVFGLALSWSYNSPDAATSLAVPNAAIWGFQLVVGNPDLVAPVVPVLHREAPAKGRNE